MYESHNNVNESYNRLQATLWRANITSFKKFFRLQYFNQNKKLADITFVGVVPI